MEKKIQNIMRILADSFGFPNQEFKDNNYEIKTILAEHDHRSFIKFELTGDIIRVEIKHFFGNLNGERNIGKQELVEMLTENSSSFQSSSAYLCLKFIQERPYAFLEAYQCFKSKWEDEDIADIIQLRLNDIIIAFGAWTFSDSIYVFFNERK